jgi:hypothetical protein
MLTRAWVPVVTGFVTFVAAHAIEAARWREWFHGEYAPWFLNSGRAVLFTSAALFAAAAVTAARTGRPIGHGLKTAAGAVAAMIAVLATGDAGTIFPIVLAVGASIVVVTAVAGALAGAALRAR